MYMCVCLCVLYSRCSRCGGTLSEFDCCCFDIHIYIPSFIRIQGIKRPLHFLKYFIMFKGAHGALMRLGKLKLASPPHCYNRKFPRTITKVYFFGGTYTYIITVVSQDKYKHTFLPSNQYYSVLIYIHAMIYILCRHKHTVMQSLAIAYFTCKDCSELRTYIILHLQSPVLDPAIFFKNKYYSLLILV